MHSRTRCFVAALATLSAVAGHAQAPAPLALKHAPRPTTAAISAADLMTRLYIFSDDSMQGRETGTVGHLKSTAYIERELKRLGLTPAGDNGSFFQNVPMLRRSFDTASTLTVDGTTLRGGADFIAQSRGPIGEFTTAEVIFGGEAGDTANVLSPDQVRGKLVLVRAPARGGGPARFLAFRRFAAQMRGAVAVATVTPELSPRLVASATRPREGDVFMRPDDGAPETPMTLTVTARAAEALLGASPETATAGQAGKSVAANLIFHDEAAPARNLVAIVRGSDPKLRGEYVAIGAHNDHIGFLTGSPEDHDSLHIYNQARFAILGLVPRGVRPTAAQDAQVAAIHINYDSIRAKHPERLDSIRNGADDDGSGTVTLLEIAEALQKSTHKPKRSILLVWHTGEEKGLLGSRWFTDHPTVPRDSIVAQLNMDMVGRGDARDIPGGGPRYLDLVGSRRLSTELGDMVESVNKTEPMPFTFDYQFDANGHPENIYCRSDHYNYARYGIPIVFFTTGLHGDYHQVTDEAEYIDYAHMARVGHLVYDIAMRVGNLDHRPVVDHPKPDPHGACRQ